MCVCVYLCSVYKPLIFFFSYYYYFFIFFYFLFAAGAFVLSVNFRWRLFCLLFVSVCTFEMLSYLPVGIWIKSVYLMVYFSYFHSHSQRHFSSLVLCVVLRLKLARLSSSCSLLFGDDEKIFAFSLLSLMSIHTQCYSHRHIDTQTHTLETFIVSIANEFSLSLSLSRIVPLSKSLLFREHIDFKR